MSAWDDLVGMVDTFVTDGVPVGAEDALVPLLERAQGDRFVDRELHVPDAARWLVGLALGYHALRGRAPETDLDRDQADLRLIVTRWLHPARPGA